MLQQLYASDDEGAQIVTPGDSQGRGARIVTIGLVISIAI